MKNSINDNCVECMALPDSFVRPFDRGGMKEEISRALLAPLRKTRKGPFHWFAAWNIVFLTNQWPMMHTVFAFLHPFKTQFLSFHTPFEAHPFQEKVCYCSHPQKLYFSSGNDTCPAVPTTTRRRKTTPSMPWSVGCAADKNTRRPGPAPAADGEEKKNFEGLFRLLHLISSRFFFMQNGYKQGEIFGLPSLYVV